jgi:hypothetical protein
MKQLVAIAQFLLIIALIQLNSPVQANTLEKILANPKVQALLGKPAELTNTLKLCDSANFRNANKSACEEAQQAAIVNKLPFEMRTVMSNSKSAQSLRELCVAAQSSAQRDSYLCLELAKADTAFAATLQGARNVPTTSTNEPRN